MGIRTQIEIFATFDLITLDHLCKTQEGLRQFDLLL